MNMIHKSYPVEVIKADRQKGIIQAIVAVMGNVDHGDDIIHNGAFTKTLSERGTKIRVLDNHNSNSVRDVIGKPLSAKELREDELPPSIKLRYPDAKGGLLTETQFDMNDDNAKSVFNKLADGYIDEWSIGFTIPKGKSDIEEKIVDGAKRLIRNIREVILFEYSPVIWGMNSATATIGAKNLDESKKRSLGQIYWDISDSFEALYFDRQMDYSGFIVNDIFDDGTMIVRAVNIEVNYIYYQLRWYEIEENDFAFDPIDDWLGGNYAFVPGMKSIELDFDTKAGKVLSQSNFDKLSNANSLISEVINSAIPQEEMSEEVDLENKSDDDEKQTDDDLVKTDKPLTNSRDDSLKEIDELLKNISSLGVH